LKTYYSVSGTKYSFGVSEKGCPSKLMESVPVGFEVNEGKPELGSVVPFAAAKKPLYTEVGVTIRVVPVSTIAARLVPRVIVSEEVSNVTEAISTAQKSL
jgi:hypothetical protein